MVFKKLKLYKYAKRIVPKKIACGKICLNQYLHMKHLFTVIILFLLATASYSQSKEDFYGTWVNKDYGFNFYMEIYPSGRCWYNEFWWHWFIKDGLLKICGTYNCFFYELRDNCLYAHHEERNGRQLPVNENFSFCRGGN